jgi:hypothetical protein
LRLAVVAGAQGFYQYLVMPRLVGEAATASAVSQFQHIVALCYLRAGCNEYHHHVGIVPAPFSAISLVSAPGLGPPDV